MKQALHLRLGQHLAMTPQLQQAIRLLQLSTLDLHQEIQEALESNLMLELDDGEPGVPQGAAEPGAAERGEEGGPELPHSDQSTDELSSIDSNQGDISADDGTPDSIDWGEPYEGFSSSRGSGEGDTDFLLHRSAAPTLRDHLYWQMSMGSFTDRERAIGTAIIDAVSSSGYLTCSLEEIREGLGTDVDPREIEAVLERIQAFDPTGVAARDPRECLILQLDQLPANTPYLEAAIRLCKDHFSALADQDQSRIKRLLKLDDRELGEVTKLIRSLNPHPGTAISGESPQYVIPDVIVFRRDESWRVELNPEVAPRLRVNAGYAKLIRKSDSEADVACLKNHLQEARWFIKSLASRNETLLRVARSIVGFQKDFFDQGPEAMHPLVLRDVAEELQMHESTVSRVTTQKYMYTPRGTFEFKYFFSSHVSTADGGECSATAIRALIRKLIAAEPPDKPLSDQQIVSALTDQGIQVARRTVAKYRESMGILSSSARRRLV